jgi:hypothetical protein
MKYTLHQAKADCKKIWKELSTNPELYKGISYHHDIKIEAIRTLGMDTKILNDHYGCPFCLYCANKSINEESNCKKCPIVVKFGKECIEFRSYIQFERLPSIESASEFYNEVISKVT